MHHVLSAMSYQRVGEMACSQPPQTMTACHKLCPSRRFCEKHGFTKPNDARALHLMNAAAKASTAASPSAPVQN